MNLHLLLGILFSSDCLSSSMGTCYSFVIGIDEGCKIVEHGRYEERSRDDRHLHQTMRSTMRYRYSFVAISFSSMIEKDRSTRSIVISLPRKSRHHFFPADGRGSPTPAQLAELTKAFAKIHVSLQILDRANMQSTPRKIERVQGALDNGLENDRQPYHSAHT
jgi:hypothetical protein